MNVVAIIRVRCKKAALEEAYANCPFEDPFITPEILVILTIEGENPGVLWALDSLDTVFASNGRKAAETKKWEETFVSNVDAQAEGSDFMRWAEMDSADWDGLAGRGFVNWNGKRGGTYTEVWFSVGVFGVILSCDAGVVYEKVNAFGVLAPDFVG